MDHTCYLFNCGGPGVCIFSEHEHYWAGWVTRETGTKSTHETALENLGSPDTDNDKKEKKAETTLPPTTSSSTTLRTTTIETLPGKSLKMYCHSTS